MPAQESGGTSRASPSALGAREVIARLQELVDTRPVGTATPLEWAVSAYFLGDLTALACLSLRSRSDV
jgi:hypothetical protein